MLNSSVGWIRFELVLKLIDSLQIEWKWMKLLVEWNWIGEKKWSQNWFNEGNNLFSAKCLEIEDGACWGYKHPTSLPPPSPSSSSPQTTPTTPAALAHGSRFCTRRVFGPFSTSSSSLLLLLLLLFLGGKQQLKVEVLQCLHQGLPLPMVLFPVSVSNQQSGATFPSRYHRSLTRSCQNLTRIVCN